jgi:hypothetical protein
MLSCFLHRKVGPFESQYSCLQAGDQRYYTASIPFPDYGLIWVTRYNDYNPIEIEWKTHNFPRIQIEAHIPQEYLYDSECKLPDNGTTYVVLPWYLSTYGDTVHKVKTNQSQQSFTMTSIERFRGGNRTILRFNKGGRYIITIPVHTQLQNEIGYSIRENCRSLLSSIQEQQSIYHMDRGYRAYTNHIKHLSHRQVKLESEFPDCGQIIISQKLPIKQDLKIKLTIKSYNPNWIKLNGRFTIESISDYQKPWIIDDYDSYNCMKLTSGNSLTINLTHTGDYTLCIPNTVCLVVDLPSASIRYKLDRKTHYSFTGNKPYNDDYRSPTITNLNGQEILLH